MYEILYIVSSAFTDAEIDGIIGKVAKIIEDAGGEIKRHEKVTKQALAYPVKKMKHGTYVLAHFNAPEESMKNTDRLLRLEDDVLRHIIVKLADGEEEFAFEMVPYVNPYEASEERRQARAPQPRPTPIAPPAPAVAEKKMSVEELDKKLDEILDESEIKNV